MRGKRGKTHEASNSKPIKQVVGIEQCHPHTETIQSIKTQMAPRTAYITGGASGIGLALTYHLLNKGWHVFIADRDKAKAQELADKHPSVYYAECDTASWDSQLSAFKAALKALGGRIDFVAPIAGIGEKKWIPLASEMQNDEFAKPDLSVVDVDLTGVLYTIALAMQQFRRQDPISWTEDAKSYRGKIGLVASVCGFYCVPSLPIYTAAKHALIGLTRSYGVLVQDEGITVNAVAPNVVRTAISSDKFYDQIEEEGLLTPMDGLMAAFEEILGGGGSGDVFECGPKGGYTKRKGAEYLDEESGKCCEKLLPRAKPLHYAPEGSSK